MRIFHIATLDDWKQSQESGRYTTSTYGRSLEEEGFIHAARHDQVPEVRDNIFGDVDEPLVVLEIETDRLNVPVLEEQVGDETFPHVYGEIPTDAVVAWRPARLPPIELGQKPERPPVPPMTVAFRGLALVLAVAALTTFICAAAAQANTDNGRLPIGVSFILWSLMAVLALAAAAAFGYAELVRRQASDRG